MSEIVKRVGEAINEALGPGEYLVHYVLDEVAICAITGMRKPTERMLEILLENGGVTGWEMAIDEALKP